MVTDSGASKFVVGGFLWVSNSNSGRKCRHFQDISNAKSDDVEIRTVDGSKSREMVTMNFSEVVSQW